MKKILSILLVLFSVAFIAFAEENPSDETEGIEKESVVSISKGIVRLDLFRNRGTFGIFVIPPVGSPRAVISSRSAFSSSGFSLRSRRSVYQLAKHGGIPSVVNVSDDSAEFIYTVRKGRVQADVKVMMSIESSTPDAQADMIKFVVETTNAGKERQTFAIRGIFDTVLGELGYTDFSTAQIHRIDEEYQFESMLADKWILSKNSVNAMQFLLSGRGITSPKVVTLANKDVVASGDWEGYYYRPRRPFTSILSYQNSAVDLVWNDFSLSPKQKTSITFYIVLGTDGLVPAGEQFLAGVQEKTVPVIPARKTEPVIAPVVETAVEIVEEPAVPQPPVPVAEELAEKPADEVPFDASVVRKEQLDPEYIRSLLERINSLESTDSAIGQDQLKSLNAELDAILNALRNM